MSFKKISLLFSFLIVTILAKAQQATQIDSVLTLAQCVDIAIKNNLTVKQSGIRAEQDRIYWQQARAALLPTLNAGAGYGISFGRGTNNTGVIVDAAQTNSASFSASSSLLLSNGLSAINTIKQNALLYQAGKMDFQEVKNETTLNIIGLYFSALNAEDQLAQAKLQFDVSGANLERENNLNNAGTVAPADFYNIKGLHNNDQINIYNAENAVLTAKINLLEAMNVAFKKDIRLERLQASNSPAAYTQSADDIYSTALTSLALVKASDLRVKAAEKEVAAATGKLFPTLTLNGNYQTSYANNSPGSFATQFKENKYYGPSLNLSIPILNGFRNTFNRRLAKLDLLNAQEVNTNTQVQLKQQIEQAHANMKNAYNRLQVLIPQIDIYQAAYDAQKTKFDAGVITSDFYITAKNNLDGANVNLINARYEYLIRTKILDYYQGKLSF
ncbi:MAG: TolC family protein [Bacteroidota bacterium]